MKTISSLHIFYATFMQLSCYVVNSKIDKHTTPLAVTLVQTCRELILEKNVLAVPGSFDEPTICILL